MAVHWNSEILKWEYRELQATAMSVDYTGNNVLLAGRRCLAIKNINLEDESGGDIVKKYPRHSKYDVAGAEWCHTYQGQKMFALASNQRVDVYEWRGGTDLTCVSSLRGHTRVVSDTHFHRQDHNLIATCSIDTYTHLWDLRDARKPVVSLSAVAGASQVQWNKVASHLVATAHDGDIKIWDYRKNSAPINYISAHLCKIHGVDWSPHHEYQLVTSSHDGSIKFFDINNARKPENVIMTNFPVWRAIYTPFGSGLLTIGVGWGGLPRAEQSGVIGIWVGGTLTHRLVGHTDTVQTMVWRPNTSPSNYHLITWGRDQSLRVWAMHPNLLKMCNHYLPLDTECDDDNTSDTMSCASTVDSMNDLSLNDNKGQDLPMQKLPVKTTIDEEFESIREMANIEVTDMNIELRTCQIHSDCNGYTANLQVTFPRKVSDHTIPKFSWLSGTNVDSSTTIKILQLINRTAYRKKKEGQRCLLHCLKTLATSIDEIPVKSSDDSDSMKSSQRSQSESENAGDACIPFPRTSGAKWCGVSTLVVFNRPANARRLSLKHESATPRSMSSLTLTPALYGSGYSSISPHATTTPSPTNAAGFPQLLHRHPSNSITTFYFQDRWKAAGRRACNVRSRGSISGCGAARVLLYDAPTLFPFNRVLAEKYVIKPDNPIEMCENNSASACAEGEAELGLAWRLAARAAHALAPRPPRVAPRPAARSLCAADEEADAWRGHPLGSNLLQTLISHYAKASDVQMAAMLACAFPVFIDTSNSISQSTIYDSTYSSETLPYSTINQYSEISADGWTIPILVRSNSCSEAENLLTDSTVSKTEQTSSYMLDEATVHLYNCFKRVYADILHRWQLLYKKTEVMKQVSGVRPVSGGCVEVVAECAWCGAAAGAGAGADVGGACGACRRLALRCAVCARAVRGLALACVYCAHAGHAQHIVHWFEKHDSCPTGCGCKCLIEGNTIWKSGKYP